MLQGSAFAGPAQILYYEPLRADAATSSSALRKQSTDFPYAFEAFGRRFDLTLARNERIALSKPAIEDGAPLRLYKGTINGAAGSWVRMGVQGERVEGLLWDGQELYVIEPVESARKEIAPPLGLPASGSIVFRLSDTHMETPATCAATHATQTGSGLDQYKAVLAELSTASNALVTSSATRRIELSAIGDALYRQSYVSEQSARDEILLRLNNVDGIYSAQIGVAIQVPTVIVETPTGTQFSTTTSSDTLLSELAVVRKNSAELRSRGLTHLFTGRDLDGDTVGVAYIDALCDSQYGVGLTQTANLSVWLESLVAAHEIGHNFGAYHDGVDAPGDNLGECAATPNNLFLMAAVVDGNHDQFSDCSRVTIGNTATKAACITPISTADIAVASNLDSTRALAGTTFDWSFDVKNIGSGTATGVRAKAFLPPTVTIAEAWVSGGTCTAGAGLIDCDLGEVAGNVTRTVNARLRSDATASNTVAVHVSATNDSGLNNNDGQGDIDIEAGVDLTLSLSAPTNIEAGHTGTGTIGAQNLSDTAAQTVTIDLASSAGLTLKSASIDGTTCAPNGSSIRCTAASMNAHSTFAGTVSFDAANGGAFTLTASIGSSDLDGNSTNNTASAAVQVTSISSAASGTKSSGGGGGAFGLDLLFFGGLWPIARRLRSGSHARQVS